jgi:hypothetical protein
MPKVRGAFYELANTREHGRTAVMMHLPSPVYRHTCSVSAKQLPARRGVCQTGEEYCRRKGDIWDEPNTEPATDNLGGGVTETSNVFAAITVQRCSSAQLGSVQLSLFSSVHFSSAEFSSVQLSSAQFGSAQFVQFNSAQFSSFQFSSGPRLDTRPSTAGVFRYIMAEMVKKCLSVLLVTVWMTMMMIQNCLVPETT